MQNRRSNAGSEYIIISEHVHDNKLEIDLELSKKVRKYFFKDKFTVEYDRNVNSDRSILAIPAISLVAPVAWATGAEIIVDRLDATYLASVEEIRRVFEKAFPQLISRSNIKTSNIVNNNLESKKTGLLFSGGLDSLTSYIRNENQHPTLITLLKADDRYPYYDKVEEKLKSFARTRHIQIHFVRSSIWDARSTTIDNRLLEGDFNIPDWWELVSHGLITLGICAPLTVSEGIGILRMASTWKADHQTKGHGSHYLVNTKLSWANTDIIYDTADLTRQGKIRQILKGNKDCYEYLRVCVDPSHYKINELESYPRNCGHCEKCLRTIAGLIMEGIDPNICNFSIQDDVLSRVRNAFQNRSLKYHSTGNWKDIQEYARTDERNYEDNSVAQKYSAEEFFKWLIAFDFDRYKLDTYRYLKREFSFSLMHRGVYPTIKQIIGYVSHKSKNRLLRKRNSKHEK